jgi:hypothetical protein
MTGFADKAVELYTQGASGVQGSHADRLEL